MREFVVISSINPVSVAKEDGVKGIKVSGTAVSHAGGKPNLNGLIYPIETIKQFASSLSGYPMVIDHENTIANTVGRVKQAYEKNGDLLYDSDINEEHPSGIGKMLDRGDVDSVSIMAQSNKIECTICHEPFGLCPHQPLQKYDGKVAAGIVQHLKWKHLSFVLDPADPYASDTKIASQNTHSSINDKLMVDICQQFIDAKNENQENIIKQSVKIMSSEENKVSQKEVETLLKAASKEKELQLKEKDAEFKQKEAEIATLLKQMEEIKATNEVFETKEKDKLISQICELSGEKPEEYSDMTVTQLEKLHKSVVAYDKKFNKDDKDKDQIGQSDKFQVGQPPKQPVYDDAEEGVKFVQNLFNLKAQPIEDEAKTVIRFISQNEPIQDGINIRGDK